MQTKENSAQIKPAGAKKTISLCVMVVFVMFFLFSPVKNAEAAFWPGVDPPIQRMLDTIYETIKGMIMGIAKKQAVMSLNSQMSSIIGGSATGSAMFITDWEDYLIGQPEDITQNYMNDYLSQMTSGRGSTSGYESEGFSGNYMAGLTQNASKNIINRQDPEMTYEGDPADMFESGNFKNMSNYLSGINNPWAFNSWIEYKNQQELEKNQRVAETKARSYSGFIGTGEQSGQGNITNPGSLTLQDTASVHDLGNKVIAGAQSIPEVIVSVVSQLITRSVSQGFSSVQRNIQREVDYTQDQTSSDINSAIEKYGPGARF